MKVSRISLLAVAVIFGVALPASAQPDITSKGGITVGGHFSAWGGSVTLSGSDASSQINGVCSFKIAYDMVNVGNADTAPKFVNRLRSGATPIGEQSNLTLDAGKSQQVAGQIALKPGSHGVTLSLDDGKVVSESNELNNVFRVKIVVNSKCVSSGPPPFITMKAVTRIPTVPKMQVTRVPTAPKMQVSRVPTAPKLQVTPIRIMTRTQVTSPTATPGPAAPGP
jgi:CARDB protein